MPRPGDGPLFGSSVSPLSPGGHRVNSTSGDGVKRPKRLKKSAPVTAVTAIFELEGSTYARARESVPDGTENESLARMTLKEGGDTGDIGDTSTNRLENVGEGVSPLVEVGAVTGGDTPSHEVEGLEVRHLAELPVPCTLTLDVPGVGKVLVSTSRVRVELERRAGRPVWAPLGFELGAYAVQEGRARPEDWRGWCARLRARGWRLDEREALGGAAGVEDAWRAARRTGAPQEPRIALGRFLRLVGARLVSCEVEGAPSAQESAEVAW